MKRANILQGWREPSENPEKDCALLLVCKSIEDNFVFTFSDFRGDIEYVRHNNSFILLAWQYLPVWEEE